MDEKILDQVAADVKVLKDELPHLRALPDDVVKAKADLAALSENQTKTAAQIDTIAKDLADFRALLKHEHGKSGADDWRKAMSDFVKSIYWQSKARATGCAIPEWVNKAAADYVTDVAAQGGYLVPTWVSDEVTKLSLRHGQIWPLLNKVTVPAGSSIKYPYESTLASAAFRTGSSSALGQGGAASEMDPAVVWGADTLQPSFASAWVKIANEAMNAPGINIPDQLALQMAAQLLRLGEYGVLTGFIGTPTQISNRTAPHNGILYANYVNTQSPMATVTYALVKTFIGECIYDHEGSGDTAENFLITTDGVAHVLKGNMTQTGVTWGDPARSWEPYVHGYRLITSPHAKRTRLTSTHDYIIMSPLNKITVAWTGNFAIDFNPFGGWTSNETWMMVSTHMDWTLGNPDMHHIASFTAYA